MEKLIAIIRRIQIELKYVIYHFGFIFVKVFYVAYIAQVPYRNLAYYRHEQRSTLKDLGFELIPELKENNKWISELVFWMIHITGVTVIISTWFDSFAHDNNILGVVLAEKWLDCLTVGHTLRFVTYMSTSLPGPASHCRVGSLYPKHNQPNTFLDMISRKSDSDDPNCGDLIFSGHMFQNIILTIIVTIYSSKILRKKYLHIIVTTLMWLLTITQIPLIIAARNHYTVDITVACYLAPMVWITLENLRKQKDFSEYIHRENTLVEEIAL